MFHFITYFYLSKIVDRLLKAYVFVINLPGNTEFNFIMRSYLTGGKTTAFSFEI